MPETDALSVGKTYCPHCHTEITVNKGYISWCEACNWNINPLNKQESAGVLQNLYSRMSRKLGEKLLHLMKQGYYQSKLTPSLCLAYILSGCVHLVSFAILVTGSWLAVIGWGKFFFLLGSLVCFVIAWLTRPRFGKLHDPILSKKEFPTLYKVANDIASVLQSKPVTGITIGYEYNAAFESVGIRGHQYLNLGLPLFAVLNAEERVALIAHELGHGVNKDTSKGFFIGSALSTLTVWHDLLRPDSIIERSPSFIDVMMIPINLILLGLSRIIYGILYFLAHLLWQDSQRAEYMADYLATKVSGVKAKVSLLEKLHLAQYFNFVLQKMLMAKEHATLFQELRQQFDHMPQQEITRIQKIGRMVESRLDSTHPPTAYRIEFLEAQGNVSPAYEITDQDQELLEQELRKLEEQIQPKIMNYYKEHQYLLH
ncbi:M48 family metallopeptidase [Brevibacillus ginsengisoli]|uniref:M48 family metallopeptidase n=1 Tax=Brevibacillus ginsengisoli TaxID=363854 RepID=UPI003CEDA381